MEERTPPPSEGPLAVKETLVVNENPDAGGEKKDESNEAAAEAVRFVLETIMDNVVEQICHSSACKDPNGSLQFEREEYREAPDSILGDIGIEIFEKPNNMNKDDEIHGRKYKNIFKKLLNCFNRRPRRADVDVDDKTVEVEKADPFPEIKSIPREAPDGILGEIEITVFKDNVKETKKVKMGIRRVIRRFFCCTSSRKSQN